MVNEGEGVPKLLIHQKNASGRLQGNGTLTEPQDQ